MRFQDKVALVTGGASGIGAATVERLVSEGARVVCTDIQEPLGSLPEGVEFSRHDVTSESEWSAVVEKLVAQWGRIDVLVQSAGTSTVPVLHEETLEGFNKTIGVNLTGTFLGMRQVLPHMLERGVGSIVNVSSHFALIAAPVGAAYHASKGGVTSLTRHAAITYAESGVRINAHHPGPTLTPLVTVFGQEAVDATVSHVPMRRIAEPREQAAAIAFLASDDASYMTGFMQVTDGGYTAA